jgi:hypothetical protein
MARSSRRERRCDGRPELPTHDPEKACPGLDPGLTDFSDKIMRKDEKI